MCTVVPDFRVLRTLIWNYWLFDLFLVQFYDLFVTVTVVTGSI